jgi:autotransporter-associated beta strand protein
MMNRVFPFLLLAALAASGTTSRADTFTVTNTNGDTSAGSLGAAVNSSVSNSTGVDTISFSSLFNTPQTITLASSYIVPQSSGSTLNLTAPSQLTINASSVGGFYLNNRGVLDLGNINLTGFNSPGQNPGLSVSGSSRAILSNDFISAGIALNQGTLELATSLTSSSVITLNQTGTIQVDAGQLATLTGGISGTGTLVVSGTGTLNLGNGMTSPFPGNYSGGTQIAGGTLEFGQVFANFYVTGTGPITIGGGGQLIFTSAISDNNVALTAGGGSLVLASFSNVSLGSLSRVAGGGLTLIPSSSSALGTTQKIGFFTTPPTVTNGIVDASIVAANSASDTSGDFLNYNVNIGLIRATYSTATAITNGVSGGTSSTSVFHAAGYTNNTIASATTLYALKVDTGVTVAGAPLTLGDGTHTAGLIINGGAIAAPTTISSSIAFAAGSEGSIYVGGNGTSDYARLYGTVTGSNGLTKNGNGYLSIANAAYTGTTTINGGTLEFDNFGSPAPGQNGSVINLGSATLVYLSAYLNGTINLTGDGTIAATNGSLNFVGTFNGNGHILTVSGPTGYGSILFTSQPTGISALNVSGGSVDLYGTLDSVAVPINLNSSTASLQVYTNTTIANPINLTGGTLQSPEVVTFSGPLSANNGTGSSTFNTVNASSYGASINLSGTISGSSPLFVEGAGSVSITGSSPAYAATINTTAANLDISGSLPKAQVLAEGSSSTPGILSGAGTIGALLLNQYGKVHPGELGQIGTLTAASFDWTSDGTPQLQFQLGPGSAPSSLLNLGTGAFTKDSGTSFVFDFLDSGTLNQEYDLINFGADNTNFLPTDFSATDLPAGLSASFIFVTNGNTESLEVEVIPEPATNVMLGAGLLSLAAFQLARRRRS